MVVGREESHQKPKGQRSPEGGRRTENGERKTGRGKRKSEKKKKKKKSEGRTKARMCGPRHRDRNQQEKRERG
jgi:hypothetical protein